MALTKVCPHSGLEQEQDKSAQLASLAMLLLTIARSPHLQ
ncbi:hypothetical protein M634_13165 [Vibrio parahaemolyticus O1:Kuk str. FDA_R31]|nr:hypothetical protein M634_13165 [Vibrio parahaemolyticus O1:Kuk str. FDA_R31]